MNQTPKPPLIVIMVSAAVTFIFSFLDLRDIPFYSEGSSAWSEGYFPLITWVPLLGLALGILAGVRTFKPSALPETIVSFTAKQLGLVLVVTPFLICLGFLIASDGEADKGIGFWFMFLGTIGLLTGVIMDLMDKTPDRQIQIGGQAPPQQFQQQYPPQQFPPEQYPQGGPPPQQGFQPPPAAAAPPAGMPGSPPADVPPPPAMSDDTFKPPPPDAPPPPS